MERGGLGAGVRRVFGEEDGMVRELGRCGRETRGNRGLVGRTRCWSRPVYRCPLTTPGGCETGESRGPRQ